MSPAKPSLILAALFCCLSGWCLPQKAVSDQDLAAYLPMRSDLADHSEAKNPVKTAGAVMLRNSAAYFDGQDASLELLHIDFANRPFAVSLWIKVMGKNPMYGLLQQEDESTFNHWLHLMLRGGRQPYLGFMMDDAISPQDIPAETWTHLAFVYTGARQELWVNGRLLCARNAPAYEGTNGATIIAGSPRWNNVPSKDFEGYMRELRIYRRALSATEVVELYNLDNDSPARAKLVPGQAGAPQPDPVLSNALAAEVGIPFLNIAGRKLVITGESRQIYEVLATSDLAQPWRPLATLTNFNGVVEFDDADAPKFPQRFYRVKSSSF